MNGTKPTAIHSITNFLFLTGSWVYNLLIHADRTAPIVFTDNRENEQVFPFSRVYCKKQIGTTLAKILRLPYDPSRVAIAKLQKARLMHSHFGNRGYLDCSLAEKLGIPHFTSFYGYDAWRLPESDASWKAKYKALFERGQLFVAEGPGMLKRLVGLGCAAEKTRLLRIGVDLNKIEFVPRKTGEDGLVKLLIAGTFTEKKGIPLALEAIGKLKDKYPNLRVIVIGDASPRIPEGVREKKKILDTISKYRLEPIVRLLGYQPHSVLTREAKRCHIFLSPSMHARDGDAEGGSPVTITEMSAAGMPIVSTLHCDIPEVVLDGKTGVLAHEKDLDGLAGGLDDLLSRPEQWAAMGRAGRAHIEKEFNLFSQIKKLEDMYSEFI